MNKKQRPTLQERQQHSGGKLAVNRTKTASNSVTCSKQGEYCLCSFPPKPSICWLSLPLSHFREELMFFPVNEERKFLGKNVLVSLPNYRSNWIFLEIHCCWNWNLFATQAGGRAFNLININDWRSHYVSRLFVRFCLRQRSYVLCIIKMELEREFAKYLL